MRKFGISTDHYFFLHPYPSPNMIYLFLDLFTEYIQIVSTEMEM